MTRDELKSLKSGDKVALTVWRTKEFPNGIEKTILEVSLKEFEHETYGSYTNGYITFDDGQKQLCCTHCTDIPMRKV
jgi:hypothetical protein